MKIGKIDLVRINEGFGGKLVDEASLDFALDKQENERLGPYKKLAYLYRAILVDHPFSDGNKKTAMFLAYAFAEEYKKVVDKDLMIHQIISIASRNLNNIRQIEWRLKSAFREIENEN